MSKSSAPTPAATLSRRTVFVGAGAVGALAAATLLPRAAKAPEQTAAVKPAPDGGYQLTEHVKHYYATARV
jgi:hypothetical protein